MRTMIVGCFLLRGDFLDVASKESLAQSYAIGPTLLALIVDAVATVFFLVVHRRHKSTAVHGIRCFKRK